MAETGPAGAVTEQARDRRWHALAICLVAGFMTLLDVSIVNVALPSMQQGLDAPPIALAWIVSGYALTFGLVLVPAGRLGDDRGRGRMFVIALLAFTVASALAGFAQNALWLVIARLLQGAAGGMLNPQVLGLMQQLFHGRDRGRAFGLFGAVVGLSTAIGPLLGGVILQFAGNEDGWRWVFFVNLPIGAAALVYALRVLPREDRTERPHNLDLVGVVLLGAGLLCLLLPLVEHSESPWYLLAAAPVLLALFVAWEHWYRVRGYAPLVDLRLLRIGSYSFGTMLGLLYFGGFTSIFFVLAVYFQRGLGYSPLEAGLAMTPFAVGSAVSSAVSGRIVYRMGRTLVIIGLVGALAGLLATDVLLGRHFGQMAGLVTALPLLVAGVGSGMVISPNQTVTLSEVDSAQGGTAAGVQQTAQRIGTALGTATASGLFFGALEAGGYDEAISSGLVVSVCFVAAALVLGITERLVVARRGR
ncbi:EmrB/QacA subfamily drug resistance transporter [Saccharopolyspora erythraea NRRL 2338]|uniref:Transmembrane efflux protein n=3 Tax=Saccharopolyspora erythraea TaxID=1836 RepID=A4FGF9_SACEN|nr:MFS transporter [Saccharopolyspora erythraea]PFG96839.1 EmrB/QacA subfamily drug resistance transporter [Saccharopolyspora erythraea NRRL 2338]QRK87078.1 MFS transporter [Saccharopolyspora erythraea]CAM03134.1 transmembrane efflux protein [Saccharopolyspora erythraea NRRL 2338]